jgi:4-amino-4-deoxy-L-arabinose transferase-like glycosyltransferase
MIFFPQVLAGSTQMPLISRVSKPLLLAVFAATLLFPGLGRLTMSRQQELRVALTARQMVQSGHWLIPEFRDQPRLRKPPLMYWLVACSFRLANSALSVQAARAPSAVAGVLLVIVIYLGGSILIGRRRAYFAALVAGSSFMLIRHARLAETDVTLVLFTTLATLSGYVALRRPSVAAWWPAGVFIGLGFLTKGPAALALPSLALVFFAAAQPSTRAWRHVGGMASAILVAAALAVPWYVMIKTQSSPQLGLELRETFTEPDHPGHFYYYGYALPKMMLPWGVFIPFAILSVFRRRAVKHSGLKFVAIWFISSFLALSLTANKQDHYALLLLPPSALLVGWRLGHLSAKRPFMRVWRSPRNQLRLTAAFIAISSLVVHAYIFWIGDQYRPPSMIPRFARQARPYTETAHAIYALGARASQLEFYLGPRARYATNFIQVWNQARPGDVIAISSDRKRPFPSNDVPRIAALDMTQQDLRCALYVK